MGESRGGHSHGETCSSVRLALFVQSPWVYVHNTREGCAGASGGFGCASDTVSIGADVNIIVGEQWNRSL